MGFLDFTMNALSAESIPQLIVNVADKAATGVAAVNSTRAAHYSKANNKILKDELVGLRDEISVISGRTSAIRADVKETNGSICAAVNQFAGPIKKLSKSGKEAEEEKAKTKAKAEKAKAKAEKQKNKAEAKAKKAKAEADAAAKKAADAAAEAEAEAKK